MLDANAKVIGYDMRNEWSGSFVPHIFWTDDNGHEYKTCFMISEVGSTFMPTMRFNPNFTSPNPWNIYCPTLEQMMWLREKQRELFPNWVTTISNVSSGTTYTWQTRVTLSSIEVRFMKEMFRDATHRVQHKGVQGWLYAELSQKQVWQLRANDYVVEATHELIA